MSSQLRARGSASSVDRRVIGRVALSDVGVGARGDSIRLLTQGVEPTESLGGYLGVAIQGTSKPEADGLLVDGFQDLSFLQEGTIVALEGRTGSLNVLYRPQSQHNFLFATERCSSSCIMCSQPPRDVDDSNAASDLLRIISLIQVAPEHLGITGGEPTLLEDGLIDVLAALRDRLPATSVTMLTNGRMFCYEDYVRKLAAVGLPRFVSSIPLYADNAQDHDYVVQVSGAFDQTQRGLYNAARHGLAVELRVVLHKQTTPRLVRLVDFVYRNLPFVQHVALMGMENTGYARANDKEVWIDPVDYVEELEEAVRQFHYRGVAVSIYNLPLCILPNVLWPFARQSISDYKNIYLEECADCRERTRCAGLFESSRTKHSRAIRAIA